jgi:hypothetical protein
MEERRVQRRPSKSADQGVFTYFCTENVKNAFECIVGPAPSSAGGMENEGAVD